MLVPHMPPWSCSSPPGLGLTGEMQPREAPRPLPGRDAPEFVGVCVWPCLGPGPEHGLSSMEKETHFCRLLVSLTRKGGTCEVRSRGV